MTEITPHIEFKQAHATEIADLTARRDAELARAAEIRAAALNGHASASADILARHAEEQEARLVSFAKHAAATFAEPVEAWCKEPNRVSTRALQETFAELDAEKLRQLGEGLGDELMWAMMRVFIARDPGSVSRFAAPANHYNEWSDSGARKASFQLCKVFRRGNGDVANQLHALEDLERTISAIAASGTQSQEHKPAERFEALASGLPTEAIQNKLLALDAEAFTAKHGTPEERQARANAIEEARNRGEQITPGFLERLKNRVAGVVEAVVSGGTSPETPVAKPRTRGKASAQTQEQGQADFDAAVALMTNSPPPTPPTPFI